MQPIIFVDMDGVLVDLKQGLSNLLDQDLTQLPLEEWNKHFYSFSDGLNSSDLTDFYACLPPMKGYETLWKSLDKYNPLILTSISKRNPVMLGKKIWCQEYLNLGPDKIYFSRNSGQKKEFASKMSILIDDSESNIVEWREAGGTAIHHISVGETIKTFENLITTLWNR